MTAFKSIVFVVIGACMLVLTNSAVAAPGSEKELAATANGVQAQDVKSVSIIVQTDHGPAFSRVSAKDLAHLVAELNARFIERVKIIYRMQHPKEYESETGWIGPESLTDEHFKLLTEDDPGFSYSLEVDHWEKSQ